ncbi:sideroflexin-4 [Syngnathoides biaculeatus]|uniref:sideroflexin-4 n=1 Tax=Syngnathoides biaculeatus TaxID=300417 RepID=UPI002ADE7373|nr:sideroflexin-4 [Syngnathoides biaculeatus]
MVFEQINEHVTKRGSRLTSTACQKLLFECDNIIFVFVLKWEPSSFKFTRTAVMDANLVYWKSHGESVFCRFKMWANLLDPSFLFISNAVIQETRSQLGSGENVSKKEEHAWNISLSSVHADSGSVLPLVFRPPAFLPLTAPLVVANFLPHKGIKPALFWQFLLQSYTAGFNYANRNSSSEQNQTGSLKQPLLIAGTVSYATCAGALPQIIVNRLDLRSLHFQNFFRFIVPVPLSAALAFVNVFTVRGEECETGIQVFDSNGNYVGISKAAAQKAVMETALSRAVLFGTTGAVPNLLVSILKRTQLFQKNPLLIAPTRHISVAFVLGLMIPLSFSLFSLMGTIRKENVEEELQVKMAEEHLFYHRGL